MEPPPQIPIYVSTRNVGIMNMEVVKEHGIVSVHHKVPLTMHKQPNEVQLKYLSVQLEQGRHGAIMIAQDQVRLKGGNALLGVTFSGSTYSSSSQQKEAKYPPYY